MKTLEEALQELDPADDGHWTKAGQPDLNHLKEATGKKVTRAQIAVVGGDIKRPDETEPEPTDPPITAAPLPASVVVGAEIIAKLDEISSMCIGEVAQRQPELLNVVRLYQAERPSILGRQERLNERHNR